MKLLSGSAILKNTWDLYVKHWRAFAEPVAWILVPTVIIGLLPVIPGATAGTELLLELVMVVIKLVMTVRIIDIAWTLYQGRAPSDSLTRTLSWGQSGRIIDYVLASILAGLVITIGFFLMVIPGIIFAVWFGFAPLAALLEGTSPGTASLKRSKELVVGRWWQIWWRWVMITIIPAFAIFIFVMLLIALIGSATGTLDLAMNTDHLTWWANLIIQTTMAIASPFGIVAAVVLFAEARKKA